MNTAEHAARLAMGWVFYYTRRLPARVAQARRDELASDLWEHRDDARQNGISNFALTLALGWRVLAGVPADLSWRFTQRMAAQGRSVDHRAVREQAAMTVGQASGVWVRQHVRTRKCIACGQRYARRLPYCPVCKVRKGHDGMPHHSRWAAGV